MEILGNKETDEQEKEIERKKITKVNKLFGVIGIQSSKILESVRQRYDKVFSCGKSHTR